VDSGDGGSGHEPTPEATYRSTRGRRPIVWVLVAAPLALAVAFAVIHFGADDTQARAAAPSAPLLPDLTMPALTDIYGASRQGSGKAQIFFTANIANIGAGPFMLRATRDGTGSPWRVAQTFRERGGGVSERETPATLVWGGHGHNHWHVRLGASYRLYKAGGTTPVRTYAKVGYCFFDQVAFRPSLPRAPRVPVFPADTCSGRERVELQMGISPGWADPYSWTLPDQRIDITGLPDGRYRLVAVADPQNWFRESNEHDNTTWVDLQVKTSVSPPTVKVVRVGPHASHA
jgi:hypothetical protein